MANNKSNTNIFYVSRAREINIYMGIIFHIIIEKLIFIWELSFIFHECVFIIWYLKNVFYLLFLSILPRVKSLT